MIAPLLFAVLAQAQVEEPMLDCLVLQAPAGYEQETGIVPATHRDAYEEASRRAREKLLERICDGAPCPNISARIQPWLTGQTPDKRQVCAMVVVKRQYVTDFLQKRAKEQATSEAEAEISIAFKNLVTALFGKRTAASRVVMIDMVSVDLSVVEVNGGPVGDFLRARMERALTTRPDLVRGAPSDYNGRDIPEGIDVVLSARASRATDRTGDVAVIWQASFRSGPLAMVKERMTIRAALISAIAGRRGTAVHPVDRTSTLVARLESRAGGFLCRGDKTQLWVSSMRNRWIQVFNLYGENGALLLFAGRIEEGETLSITSHGFIAARALDSGEDESFLVVSSATPEPVLAIRDFKDRTCRLDTAVANRLRNWSQLPLKFQLTGDGFRVVADRDCPAVDELKAEAEAKAVEELPLCTG